MKIKALYLPFLLGMSLSSVSAQAEQHFCASPWLKNGVTISGKVSNDANIGTFSIKIQHVQHPSAQQCSADLKLSVNSSQGVVPLTGSADLHLKVTDKQFALQGALNTSAIMQSQLQAQVNLQANDFMLLKPLDRVPEQATQVAGFSANADVQGNMMIQANQTPLGQLNVSGATLQAPQRLVSGLQNQSTALGKMSCQTVSYVATAQTGQLFIPALFINKKSKNKSFNISELYCPKAGLSSKITIGEGQHQGVVEVTKISP
ncbi:hypothetical protein [Brackiella oedipodis]|uniref:hypothetical protein n=1 Tax=Brackiella oedipodis TaxID=124225 RepID=UPI00048BEDFA|nr:hypothetical protein [Brackiella oedipodis]